MCATSNIKIKKIAIITTASSWFFPHAVEYAKLLKQKGYEAKAFSDHKKVTKSYDVVFLLSYFRIVETSFINMHKYCLVVHESDLPKGKGWAPLFWQIIEGENNIPIGLFDASVNVDSGDSYIKDFMRFNGTELNAGLRRVQAKKTVQLCMQFLSKYKTLKAIKQKSKGTWYRKRNPADSELDINKTIKRQFNLLRTVDNQEYPAFFEYKGCRYKIVITKQKK